MRLLWKRKRWENEKFKALRCKYSRPHECFVSQGAEPFREGWRYSIVSILRVPIKRSIKSLHNPLTISYAWSFTRSNVYRCLSVSNQTFRYLLMLKHLLESNNRVEIKSRVRRLRKTSQQPVGFASIHGFTRAKINSEIASAILIRHKNARRSLRARDYIAYRHCDDKRGT